MGLWFFLTAVVLGNIVLKAYKLRSVSPEKLYEDRIKALELELKAVREKIQHLDEAVFLGEFELKRQFRELEAENSTNNSLRS